MSIAILTNEYPPAAHGGIGSFSADLAQGLAAHGAGVDVVVAELGHARGCRMRDCVAEGANPRIWRTAYSAPSWMRWRPGALWQRWQLRADIAWLNRRQQFQIVECVDNGGLLPWGVRRVRTVLRLHGASFFYDAELGSMTSDPFTHQLEKRTLAAADHLVGVSRFVADGELRRAGSLRAADSVIYNAVDTEREFRPDLAVPKEDGLIVFANAIHPRKGVHELCAAMDTVMERFPSARLAMLGRVISDARSGPSLEESLLDRVRPEFRSRIRFTGGLPRSEVRDWIKRAHVCCYPSKLEAFGLAPVEAMAMGKPTIYSRTGAGPEVIEDGVSGLLCDPSDPADIAAKICAVLGNRELESSLAVNGRRRVVEMFDRRRWIERNLEFYRECLQRRRTKRGGDQR